MSSAVENKKVNKFKDYFLQFLMLFLAIFLGAIGENYRQQYTDEVVERNKERETLEAMANDLQTDIINLDNSIKNKSEKGILANKLIGLLNDSIVSKNNKEIYYCARVMTTRDAFSASEGAVTQLQYSGGYNMITSSSIIDQINKYHYIKEKIYKLNETEEHILIEYRIAASKIFKAAVFSSMLDAEKHKNYKYYIKPLETDIRLFSTNTNHINEFIFWVSSANGNQSANRAQMLILKQHSLELISSIQKHLTEGK